MSEFLGFLVTAAFVYWWIRTYRARKAQGLPTGKIWPWPTKQKETKPDTKKARASKQVKQAKKPRVWSGTWTAPQTKNFDLIIVGTEYYEAKNPKMKRMTYQVTLEREPHNKHDHNAIAVKYKKTTMGYVSAYRASTIAPILDNLRIKAVVTRAQNDTSGNSFVEMPRRHEQWRALLGQEER